MVEINRMEEWREYPKDPRYLISNRGQIISRCYKEPRLLSLSEKGPGYSGFHLGYTHHIVWDTFGNQERNNPDYEINHINHNRQDNRIENLEYVSRELNRQNNSSKFEGTQMKYLTKSINGYHLRIQRNHTYVINKWFSNFEEACKERDKFIYQSS